MFLTMPPLVDTLASFWSFCPAGTSIKITPTVRSANEAATTEKPQIGSKAG